MTNQHSNMKFLIPASIIVIGAVMIQSVQSAEEKKGPPPVGYSDTPFLPDGKWRVHDIDRPQPCVVTPGELSKPPSDAIVLFDGKDLSKWLGQDKPKKKEKGKPEEPRPIREAKWKVENGYMEVNGSGTIWTKEEFGSCQLHIEWATPAEVIGASQERGNSGVFLMNLYEVQVLDSYNNRTYADGSAGSVYGQYPPLVNAARKPGEWQVYDIIFEAQKFEGDKLVKPAYITILHNGVVVQHMAKILGKATHKKLAEYTTPYLDKGPLALQDHNNPTRYRNIWIRPLKGYDEN